MHDDFTIYQAAYVFDQLEQFPPLTTELVEWQSAFKGDHWTDQRDHMTSWFLSQDSTGGGKYTRRRPNTSARVTYNRLLTAPGLLWIAEALGIETERCHAALEVAKDTKDNRRRLKYMREILPWPDIAEKIADHMTPKPLDPPLEFWTLEDQAQEIDDFLFNNHHE